MLRTILVSESSSGSSCILPFHTGFPTRRRRMAFNYGAWPPSLPYDDPTAPPPPHDDVDDDDDDDEDVDADLRSSPVEALLLHQLPAALIRGDANWSMDVICECADALAEAEDEEDADVEQAAAAADEEDDTSGHGGRLVARVRVRQLLWVLNELASPYGTRDQRLAAAFLQGLFCRFSKSGVAAYSATVSAATAERSCSFDSLRRTALAFQEASPWTTFGHVASNGAILEALEGETRAHIIDLSDSLCTQWPTLLEALATRAEGAPTLLRLTTVVFHDELGSIGGGSSALGRAMEEVGARLERFARLMGVPFQFALVRHADLQGLLRHEAAARADDEGTSAEALVINCVQALHKMTAAGERQAALRTMRALAPKVVTVVEEDAEVGGEVSIGRSVREAVRLYDALFESLEECLARTSAERLAVERAAGRSILRAVAASGGEAGRERAAQWEERLMAAGFSAKGFSEDVVDDVRALLKRYPEGWGTQTTAAAAGGFGGGGGGAGTSAAAGTNSNNNRRHSSVTLTWKDRPVICASAWSPSSYY